MKSIFMILASIAPIERSLRQFIRILRDSILLQDSHGLVKHSITYLLPFEE